MDLSWEQRTDLTPPQHGSAFQQLWPTVTDTCLVWPLFLCKQIIFFFFFIRKSPLMRENIKREVTQSILNQFILSTNIYCRAMCSTLLGAEEAKTDK